MDQVYLLYQLKDYHLELLYEKILARVVTNGATITISDLSRVIEEKVLLDPDCELPEGVHHETAISNGVDIFLHFQMEDGLIGRIYDLLHLGIGHFTQWNGTIKSDLQFYGENAWQVATKSYLGASPCEIEIAEAYELEAGKIALGNLEEILLNATDFSKVTAKNILRFFNDYINTDIEYIINYYHSGILPNFFGCWKFNSKKIPSLTVSKHTIKSPRERINKCLPLVRRLE